MSDSVQPHRQQPTRFPCPWDSLGKNTGVGCHCLLQCMKVKSESEVTQSCPTLSNPMDCSPPGSSVHGIFQQEYWSGCYRLLRPSWLCSLNYQEQHFGTFKADGERALKGSKKWDWVKSSPFISVSKPRHHGLSPTPETPLPLSPAYPIDAPWLLTALLILTHSGRKNQGFGVRQG